MGRKKSETVDGVDKPRLPPLAERLAAMTGEQRDAWYARQQMRPRYWIVRHGPDGNPYSVVGSQKSLRAATAKLAEYAMVLGVAPGTLRVWRCKPTDGLPHRNGQAAQ